MSSASTTTTTPIKPIDAVRALLLESHPLNRNIITFNDDAVFAKVDNEISIHQRETELSVEDRKILEELVADLQELNMEDEFPPIDPDPVVPSNASVISQGYERLQAKLTPPNRSGQKFPTAKRWLTNWLKHVHAHYCHATQLKFEPAAPSLVQFAHIHLPQAVQRKSWADKVVRSL